MDPNNTATFEVVFSESIAYFDPEFGSVDMKFDGKAMAVPSDPSSFNLSAEQANSMAKIHVTSGLQEAVTTIHNESYKVISSRLGSFVQAIDSKLKTSAMTLAAISFDSIAPSENSQKHIDSMEKAKTLANDPAASATPAASSVPAAAAAPVLCKFCPACGHPASGSKFCTNCGNSLVRG